MRKNDTAGSRRNRGILIALAIVLVLLLLVVIYRNAIRDFIHDMLRQLPDLPADFDKN